MKRDSQTKKKRISRFHLAVALFIAIVAVSVALTVMIVATSRPEPVEETAQNAFLGVRAVEVVGETRYSREAIAGISGIRVGQSILSVNKRQAAEKHPRRLSLYPVGGGIQRLL